MLYKVSAVALFFSFSMLLAPATFAYGGDGNVTVNDPQPPPVPDGECWDGTDNDGDGDTDIDDPGCVNPPQSDLSELDKRDFDGTWVFAGETAPSQFTPSLFFGTPVNNSQTSMYNSDWGFGGSSGGDIYEQYLEDSTVTWAGGDPTFEAVSLPSGYHVVESSAPFPGAEIVKSQSSYSSTLPDCGNAIRNPGDGEDNFNCPSDMGLPDDLAEADGGTISQSEDTITWSILYIDITNYKTVNADSGDEVEEFFDYDDLDANLDAKEYQGGNSAYLIGDRASYDYDTLTSDVNNADEDTTVGSSGDTKIRIADEDSWTDNPDFYMDSDPNPVVKAVYVNKKGLSDFGAAPITAYYLDSEDTKTAYDDSTDTTTGDTCDDYGAASCSSQSSTEGCKSGDLSTKTIYEFEYGDVRQQTLSEDMQHLQTSYSEPSYNDDTTSSSQDFYIEYYNQAPGYGEDHEICTGGTSTATYNYDCNNVNYTTGDYCNINYGDGITVIESSGEESGYWGYDSTNVDIQYEDLELLETTVYSTYYPDKPSGATYDPINALFQDDTFRLWDNPGDIVYKEEYYSVDSGGDPNRNSNSVSRSRFEVTIKDSEFYSTREEYATFDVDGEGYGQNFFSIDDQSGAGVIGYNPGLANEEVVSGDYSGDDFVGPDEFSASASCPEDYYYCVGTAQIGLNSLDSWGSTDPNSGVEFSSIQNVEHVNSSYGVCRLFQYLRKEAGSSQTPLRCQYDNARNFPGNPTPKFKKPEVPFIGEIRYN